MFLDIIFYLFALAITVSGLMVISAKNPVHSVLFLVLAFFSAAGLFILLEAEFLAAIMVMVYMGAVAILFLFVVMMLNIDFTELRQGFRDQLPIIIMVSAVVLVELMMVALHFHLPEGADAMAAAAGSDVGNTQQLGRLLYTKYLYPFEVASLVLLVALIGAVVLTFRQRKDVRTQCVAEQLARTREEAVELKKVAPGEGA